MPKMVLALYDCRSKQEYIYRTNRIREISGGSALLAGVYESFIDKAQENGISFMNGGKWEELIFNVKSFESSDCKAEVVYIGGGNLMVLYKDIEDYKNANRLFSRMLLDNTFTITAIAASTPYTGDFKADRKALYAKNALNKSTGYISVPCSVLPFTQVDNITYMPIVEKNKYKQESLSRESVCKYTAYDKYAKTKMEHNKDIEKIQLDEIVTEKGRESLLAIIYIDGNNMGSKLMNELGNDTDYDICINKLRQFSVKTNSNFVVEPIKAIEQLLLSKIGTKQEKYAKYRKIIAGGDEITLICNARMVPEILNVYFNTLDSKNSGNYACAGVAIFHSHAPFADVYEITEQCCESGKKQSRKFESKANFIDFHFCRFGITNDMETVREEQEIGLTARPYRIDDEREGYSFGKFIDFANRLKEIKRSNIKELASAMIKGESYYRFEIARINSRYKSQKLDGKDEKTKRMIFDIAQVYDLWFVGEEEDK